MKEKKEREFIIPCSNVTEDIWWPERSCFPEDDIDEIVRCKDCVNYEDQREPVSVCLFTGLAISYDGFCCWGERRTQV